MFLQFKKDLIIDLKRKEKGFLSTTTNFSIAEKFASKNSNIFHCSIIYKIKLKNNTKILDSKLISKLPTNPANLRRITLYRKFDAIDLTDDNRWIYSSLKENEVRIFNPNCIEKIDVVFYKINEKESILYCKKNDIDMAVFYSFLEDFKKEDNLN